MTGVELVVLLDELEHLLPLRAEVIAARFGVTFTETKDQWQRRQLVATSTLGKLSMRPATDDDLGELALELAAPVTWRDYLVTFPGGHSTPPPPPGIAPSELQGGYVVTRPWGQFWFTFYSGDRLVRFSMGPGRSGSPGV